MVFDGRPMIVWRKWVILMRDPTPQPCIHGPCLARWGRGVCAKRGQHLSVHAANANGIFAKHAGPEQQTIAVSNTRNIVNANLDSSTIACLKWSEPRNIRGARGWGFADCEPAVRVQWQRYFMFLIGDRYGQFFTLFAQNAFNAARHRARQRTECSL